MRTSGADQSPISDLAVALIVISVADLLTTYFLLWQGGRYYEANPLARWVFERWNVAGMTAFKFILVAAVVTIGEFVARSRPRLGRLVILFACLSSGAGVAHGLRLWLEHG
ncbi:MAG: DUF5658 family protein [Isosphaeraceae bacterium]